MKGDKYIAVDLFSGTGSATKYFRKSDEWNVYGFDIEPEKEADFEFDVLDLRPKHFGQVDFVWSSPPCKSFSIASIGHHYNLKSERLRIPESADAIKGLKMVYHSLYLISNLDPDYWFLENPRGNLRKIIGEPQYDKRREMDKELLTTQQKDELYDGTVTYCQFGDDRMKPTDLWGNHPDSFEYRFCGNGENCHESASRGSKTGTQGRKNKSDRWRVPDGLAKHVFETVNNSIS